MMYTDTPRLFRLRKRKQVLTASLKLKLDRQQRRNLGARIELIDTQIYEILYTRLPKPTVITPNMPIQLEPEELVSKEGKLQRIMVIEAIKDVETHIKRQKTHRWTRRQPDGSFRAIGSRETRRNNRNRLEQLKKEEDELWEQLSGIR